VGIRVDRSDTYVAREAMKKKKFRMDQTVWLVS
jgi:hypothetical protein